MKVKELLKNVHVAWSLPGQHPIMLAAGSAAQQVDETFSTSASLDLYNLNLQKPGYDMELIKSVPSEHRFHKLIWGPYGQNPAGIIIGGSENGTIKIYSADKMLANDNDCVLTTLNNHTGAVRALDLSPFQCNLLASGATESEILIWDVAKPGKPFTPGAKSQPPENVQYIQWNKQVQHILASTFSQRCVIWDLRKNEAIIKLTDPNSKARWTTIQWHPETATQLCLASEDDQAPIIQLWDLRFATSPLKTFERHTRGVLSIAWNSQDPDLLLSCAKDNTILCWNPNSDNPGGEVLCELAQTRQWNFDVSWCPRNPGLAVGSSCDGHVVVYSLLGGQQQASNETSNQILDSFPGMDPFTQPLPKIQSEPAVPLKKAPKWLKKPAGASFGFGGKLTIFENEPANKNTGTPATRKVYVSQVVTNPEMIQRSNDLENTLKNEQFFDYCQGKIATSNDEHSRNIWNYVGAYFSTDITKAFLDLLGYNFSDINEKLKQFVPQEDIDNITDGIGNLDSIQNGGNNYDVSATFDAIAQHEQKKNQSPQKILNTNLKLNTSDDEDGLITQAILVGNIEAAVSLCFSSKRYADAVILSMAGGPELLAKAQYRYFSEHTGALNTLINSLVSDNWNDIVKNCDINCWKEILVGIFTHASTDECSLLCENLGDRLASSLDIELKKQAQICYICSGNLNKMIQVSEYEIQETVELVMIMKRALEIQGLKAVTINGKIAEILSQYAELLASEGDLNSAINYLGQSQDPKIVSLRDRLSKALNPVQQPIVQKPVSAKSLSQNYYNQPTQMQYNQQYNQPTQVPAWNTSPTINSYPLNPPPPTTNQFANVTSPGQNIKTMSSPMLPQIPASKTSYNHSPVQPPPMQPPPPTNQTPSRPSSVGPQSGRKPYMLDPSVKPVSSYSSYNQQPQMYHSPSVNDYSPQSFQKQTTPVRPYSPSAGMYQPLEPEPYNQTNIMSPPGVPLTEQPSIFNPARVQQPNQNYNNEPVYQPPPQKAGWNDPPIAKSHRPQPPTTDFQAQNPIMHPLGNAMPQQNFNQPEEHYHQDYNSSYQNQQMPMHPGYGNMPQQQQQQQPVETLQPVQHARIVEPERPKAPIPDEHLHLKTVLDELKLQCHESAKNPQTKRKIEDVARKLEVLYDCLRENSLTPNTLQGLHQISQMIQTGNYMNGLSIHSHMVAGPDFSQIASFMPGIKVLLQCALQLNVCIT